MPHVIIQPWELCHQAPKLCALTTAEIGIELLMDSTAALQEIEARIIARTFGAVPTLSRDTAARLMLEQLLAVLGGSSPDVVI